MRVAVGVLVYNEAANLDRLLTAVRAATGDDLEVRAIVVVSSGSADASVPIARAHAARDGRVSVIDDPERRGKATAINQFLNAVPADIDACVLTGGDVLPLPGALAHLCAPLRSAGVGMTGAHPVPVNDGTRIIDRVVRLLWDLHDRLASRHAKMGELIAFRAGIPALDPSTAVDEAYLEAGFAARGERIVYVREALVENRGPGTLGELIEQRRRIWTGHYLLWRDTGYAVATMGPSRILAALAEQLREHPEDLGPAAVSAGVELVARALGTLDAWRGKNPTVWKRLASTKDLRRTRAVSSPAPR